MIYHVVADMPGGLQANEVEYEPIVTQEGCPCCTPGCELLDRHRGLCSSLQVSGAQKQQLPAAPAEAERTHAFSSSSGAAVAMSADLRLASAQPSLYDLVRCIARAAHSGTHSCPYPGIRVIPNFAQDVLGIDPVTFHAAMLSSYPVNDPIVPGAVQWVSGENAAMHIRGAPLQRTLLTLQKDTDEYRAYTFTGWQWASLPSTANLSQCEAMAPVGALRDPKRTGGQHACLQRCAVPLAVPLA